MSLRGTKQSLLLRKGSLSLSAPLSKDIAEFFYAMEIVVLEGYGLTETSPVISLTTFENPKFGAVGKPIPGVEVKVAEDGEILTKGPHVMMGYYKIESQKKYCGEKVQRPHRCILPGSSVSEKI